MSDPTQKEPKQGDLAQEILNRIVTDADFRQQLLNNPAETLAKAGYTGGDDVSGYVHSLGGSLLGHGPTIGGKALGGGGDPPTTAINCGPPPPATTAINCGVNPPSSTIKPKLTNS